jgi:hypothetical protein
MSPVGIADIDLTTITSVCATGGVGVVQNVDCLTYQLTDAKVLTSLEAVKGNLNMSRVGLTNLTGLDSLVSVKDTFNLSGNEITNLDELSGLTSVGALLLQDNLNLTSVSGLSNLTSGVVFLPDTEFENKMSADSSFCQSGIVAVGPSSRSNYCEV